MLLVFKTNIALHSRSIDRQTDRHFIHTEASTPHMQYSIQVDITSDCWHIYYVGLYIKLTNSEHFPLPCEKSYVIIRCSKPLQAELAGDGDLRDFILEPWYFSLQFFDEVKGHIQRSRFRTVAVVVVRMTVHFPQTNQLNFLRRASLSYPKLPAVGLEDWNYSSGKALEQLPSLEVCVQLELEAR